MVVALVCLDPARVVVRMWHKDYLQQNTNTINPIQPWHSTISSLRSKVKS
jgi:hypothetical protein